ncbi:hypothetical protein GmHk_11G031761 [Glycine max]|nr:hypothetical protein GmHk_11G031761 [Glycine max]
MGKSSSEFSSPENATGFRVGSFTTCPFSRTKTCCIHVLSIPNAKSRATFSLGFTLSKRTSLGVFSSPTSTETTIRHLISLYQFQLLIQLRVDLTGDQTQKVFDRILTNLGRTAPPVPGFRMQKGDPKGLPCTDAWGRTCHQVLNTRNTQLYHG